MIRAMDLVDRLEQILHRAHREHRFSGAGCVVAIDGHVAFERYIGSQASVESGRRAIPPDEQVPVTADTVFDLASISKLFTAHTALSLVDKGNVPLDEPIAEFLSAYRSVGRDRITLRHLLSHTSGLPAVWLGWLDPLRDRLSVADPAECYTEFPVPDREALVSDLLATPLESAPGERFIYSCTGYNTVALYVEAVTGRPWDELLRIETVDRLGLPSVTYDPDRGVVAATEFQPEFRRSVVRGTVHDEAAWSLGGHAGNAGLFSTALDLLAFAEAARCGYGRVLGEWMWDEALISPSVPSGDGVRTALGFRIGDADWLGADAGDMRCHIGFTGTLVAVDRPGRVSCVLLTNRVHPSRHCSIDGVRRDVVSAAAAAAR